MNIKILHNRSLLTDGDLAIMCSDWLTGRGWKPGVYDVAVDQYAMIHSISLPCCQRATNCQIWAGPDRSVSVPCSHSIVAGCYLRTPPLRTLGFVSGSLSTDKVEMRQRPKRIHVNPWLPCDAPDDLLGSWWRYGDHGRPAQVTEIHPDTGAICLTSPTADDFIDLPWLLTVYTRVPAPVEPED